MRTKLLFIDDDADTRDVMADTLTLRGFEVVCVNTGAEALARLEDTTFDAVVSDLNMPGMSGLDFCRRAHRAQPNLPLLLLTGFLSAETKNAALRAGAFEVLSKPIRVQELLLALEHATTEPRTRRKTPLHAPLEHGSSSSPRS